MSLLEILPIRVTPGSLPREFRNSRRELLSPSVVNLGALALSCYFLNSCPDMSLLELLPRRVTPAALAQSCHFLNSYPAMSLFELLSSHVIHRDLALSCNS